MKIAVDLKRMNQVYGDEMEAIILENMDIIEKNADTLKQMGFDDIEGIFERCPDLFFYFPKSFKEKMEKINQDLGEDYVEKIENDISILEKYC